MRQLDERKLLRDLDAVLLDLAWYRMGSLRLVGEHFSRSKGAVQQWRTTRRLPADVRVRLFAETVHYLNRRRSEP